jgi:hypothetical protein
MTEALQKQEPHHMSMMRNIRTKAVTIVFLRNKGKNMTIQNQKTGLIID